MNIKADCTWQQFAEQVSKHIAGRQEFKDMLTAFQAENCIDSFLKSCKIGQEAFALLELAYHAQMAYEELANRAFGAEGAINLVRNGQAVKSLGDNPVIVLGVVSNKPLNACVENILPNIRNRLRLHDQYVVLHPTGLNELTHNFPDTGSDWVQATEEDINQMLSTVQLLTQTPEVLKPAACPTCTRI